MNLFRKIGCRRTGNNRPEAEVHQAAMKVIAKAAPTQKLSDIGKLQFAVAAETPEKKGRVVRRQLIRYCPPRSGQLLLVVTGVCVRSRSRVRSGSWALSWALSRVWVRVCSPWP